MIKTELVELLSIEDVKEALINKDCIEVSVFTRQSRYYGMFYKIIGIEQDKVICVYENSWNNNLKYRMSIDFNDCKVYCNKIFRTKLEESWNPDYCNSWVNKNKSAEDFTQLSNGKKEFVKGKLKPCRWCGEIPFLDLHYSQASKIYVRIICNNDECPLESCYLEDMIVTKPGTQELLDFVEHCIEKWNN